MNDTLAIKSYNLLNIMKTIAAFFVVTIHVWFPNPTGEIFVGLARFAVPYFFMVAGFFSYYGNQPMSYEKFFKKSKHIIFLFLFGVLFFYLYNGTYISFETLDKNFKQVFTNRETLIDFLVFNRTDFIAPVLWFLPALFCCTVIFFIFDRNKMSNTAAKIFIPMFFVGIAIREIALYTPFFAEVNTKSCLCRNFLLIGLPFYYLGYIVREKEAWFKKIKYPILIISMVLGATEAVLMNMYHLMKTAYLGTFVSLLAMFILLLKLENKIKLPVLSKLTGKYSLYIYMFHMAVYKELQLQGIIDNTPKGLRPILVFAVSFVLAAILNQFGKLYNLIKKKCKIKKQERKAAKCQNAPSVQENATSTEA